MKTIPSREQRDPNFHEKKTLAPSASPSISKLNPNATHFKPHKIFTKDMENRKRNFQPPPGFPSESVVLPAKNPAFQDTNYRSQKQKEKPQVYSRRSRSMSPPPRSQIQYPSRQSPVRHSCPQNSRSYSNFSQSPNVIPHENNSVQQNTQFSAYPQTIVRPHVQETLPLITGNFSFQICPRNSQILLMKAKFSVKGHGPLPELTLPAQNLESGFKSLATEIGKWCV